MHIAVSIAILVLILVGWVLCLVSIKPNIFRIARSVKIKAPPEALYPYVVDFHRWIEWSPWEGIDADLKRTYEARRLAPARSTAGRAPRSARGAWRSSRTTYRATLASSWIS
ncbi:MAG: hypothetical protein WDN45_07015 [Caulobacteraceae bacterium]